MTDPMHQFMVQTIVPLHLFGHDISFTNSALFMAIATTLLIALFYFGVNPKTEIPSRTQVVLESVYNFITDTLRSNVGEEALPFFPYVFSIFLFVAAGNLLGMLPYSFTFTSQVVVSFGLAFSIFIAVTIIGFIKHGTHYLRLFFPEDVPIYVAPLLVPVELISYCARPITLSVRLFANMVAGHAMMKIFAGFAIACASTTFFPLAALPIAINVLLTVFEIFICILQAYVFTILSCIYLNDAINMH
ncbi:MAG: F0F1 ATP synthase subunit A [Alphaproteobacteria bacterium]